MTVTKSNKPIRVRGKSLRMTCNEEKYLKLFQALNQAFLAHLHFDVKHDTVEKLRQQFNPAYEIILEMILVSEGVKSTVKIEELRGLTHDCVTIGGYLKVDVTRVYEVADQRYNQNYTISVMLTDRQPLLSEMIGSGHSTTQVVEAFDKL